jgi:outer membrane protein OmpA-like peptidoglycan-associated protein
MRRLVFALVLSLFPMVTDVALPATFSPDAGIRSNGLALTVAQSNTFMVFFGRGEVAVSDAAARNLDQMIKEFSARKGKSITIKGHADGSEADDVALSKSRAEAVRNTLIARGIPAKTFVYMSGFGNSTPLVKGLAPGAAEPQNRRAEINFEY